MSNEFNPRFLSGKTLYAQLRRATDGQIWTGSTWELPTAADWASYALAMTEASTTGYYYGSMPGSLAAGLYGVAYFMQVGGSPATTDPLVCGQSLDWSGTADTPVFSMYALINTLAGKPITYTGPINPVTGAVTLIAGDDYLAANARALSFALPTTGGNPDLTGATVTAAFYAISSPTPALTTSTSIVSPGGSSQSVSVPLTAAQTGKLRAGKYTLVLAATLADGHVWTLAEVACTANYPQSGIQV